MSERVYAPVNPEVLAWARKSVSYDLIGAAKKIGVSSSRLEDFERGEALPTTRQLLKISKVYDCPFAAFFFKKPPNQLKYELGRLGDWRKLPGSHRRNLSPELTLELRQAIRRRDILLDIADDTGEQMPAFAIAKPVRKNRETAVKLAENIREILDVSVRDQKRMGNVYNALRIWRKAVEQLEVIVSQTGLRSSVDPKEMRGVAISYDTLPIILINGKDPPTARIFTLIHELGHLVLREGGISNDYASFTPGTSEVFCNEFAGELLVPKNALLEEQIVATNRQLSWEDDDLDILSRRFKVGKEVILRRLLVHGRTNHAHYSKMVKRWRMEWEDQQSAASQQSGGARPYHERFTRYHGARFVSSVLEAYGQETIHAGQLSEYLGANLKYMPGIISDLARVTA